MKRFFPVMLLAVLLLGFLPFGVRAAGSASLSGPSVVRAGDSISVVLRAGGGIQGGEGTISYDSTVLTYQGFTQLIGSDFEVSVPGERFMFSYGDAIKSIESVTGIFQLNFTVKADVAPGTVIRVQATNVILSAGDADQSVGTLTYSTTVAEPLSDNCSLKAMTVTGATISPAFSSSVTNYRATVPFSTSKIDVAATADHEKARVSVQNPGLTAGSTTYVQVTVTAENGATKTYTIAVTREQDPNYVPSSNRELKSLSVEGYALSPAFDKAVTQYYVWLPYEAETLRVSAEAEDSKAGLVIGEAALLPGIRADIPVVVTAEDGTQKTYTVTAVRAPEHEKTEQYINGDRETLPPEAPEETVPQATEPPTEPAQTAPDATQPTAPAPAEDTGYSLLALIVAAALGALLAASVTVLIFCWKKIF